MAFLDEADPDEVELARRWEEAGDIGETYDEFARRMGWPVGPEKEMPF